MAKPMEPTVSRKLLTILQARSDLLPLEVLLRTGIRSHELRSLAIFETHVEVTAAKGSNDHIVPITDELYARLTIHWALFLTQTQNRCHGSFKALLREMWGKLRQEHPFLKPYSLHSLRGAFALLMYQETKDPLLCQELLGHRSIQSTMVYVSQARIHDNRDKILKAVG